MKMHSISENIDLMTAFFWLNAGRLFFNMFRRNCALMLLLVKSALVYLDDMVEGVLADEVLVLMRRLSARRFAGR